MRKLKARAALTCQECHHFAQHGSEIYCHRPREGKDGAPVQLRKLKKWFECNYFWQNRQSRGQERPLVTVRRRKVEQEIPCQVDDAPCQERPAPPTQAPAQTAAVALSMASEQLKLF